MSLHQSFNFPSKTHKCLLPMVVYVIAISQHWQTLEETNIKERGKVNVFLQNWGAGVVHQ